MQTTFNSLASRDVVVIHDDVIKRKHFVRVMVTGEFHAQKTVTRSFDVFFDLSPNKRLSKQS